MSRRTVRDVDIEHVYGDSSTRLVFGNVGAGLQHAQDDTEVVVLHERSGVLTRVPRRLTVKPIDSYRQIEFFSPPVLSHRASRGRVGLCAIATIAFPMRAIFGVWNVTEGPPCVASVSDYSRNSTATAATDSEDNT
jgi:hypothetical protein